MHLPLLHTTRNTLVLAVFQQQRSLLAMNGLGDVLVVAVNIQHDCQHALVFRGDVTQQRQA